MIYLETKDGHTVIMLEPANVAHMAKGGVALSPDNRIAFMYVPDAQWTSAQLLEYIDTQGALTAAAVDQIHTQAMKRAPVVLEQSGGQIIHNGQPVKEA